MDIKAFTRQFKQQIGKYKYAIIVLLIGITILLIPEEKHTQTAAIEDQRPKAAQIEMEELSKLLQSVYGAGDVRVMLSLSEGERIIYQTNQDLSGAADTGKTKIETVIVTDSQRNEAGLISQVNPPKYLGAIVVCQGADRPAVKLAITQAVAKITGLGMDQICVLKMK